MESSIIVTVNLAGAIGGCVKSVDKQLNVIHLAGGKNYSGGPHKKIIKHTNRKEQVCTKTFTISGEIVTTWVSGPPPNWARDNRWSNLSKNQRIALQIHGYDEGFGTSFKFIHDN